MPNKQVWLTLKPNHIDDNFENFLLYMRTAVDKEDALYLESLRLLRERVDNLIEERQSSAVFRYASDEKTLIFQARLCGTWLLCLSGEAYLKRKLVTLLMINSLLQLCVVSETADDDEFIEPLALLASGLVGRQLPPVAMLNWDDIASMRLANRQYIVALRKLSLISISSPQRAHYEGKGVMVAHNGQLTLSPLSKHAFDIQQHNLKQSPLDEGCNLFISTTKDKAIKESEKDSILAVERAVDYLLEEIAKAAKATNELRWKHYNDNEEVAVEVVRLTPTDIILRTTDPTYTPIEGKLVFNPHIRIFQTSYPPELWRQVMKVGDRLMAVANVSDQSFSITERLVEFIEAGIKLGATYNVSNFLIEGKTEYLEFWSEQGEAIFVKSVSHDEIEQLQRYDGRARLTVKSRGYGLFKGLSFGTLDFDFDESFDPIVRDQVRKPFLLDFLDWLKPDSSEMEQGLMVLSHPYLKELCASLHALQQAETDPLRRFRLLCALRLLCAIGDSDDEVRYFTYFANYLRTLILFTQAEENEGQVVKPVPVPPGLDNEESIANGEVVLDILSLFARDYQETVDALQSYTTSESENIGKIASLVLSYNRLQHILEKKTLYDIKLRILSHLSIAAGHQQRNVELVDNQRDSFGYEDDMKEFKASYFTPPADATDQQEGIYIFKGVCAMLNSKGGSLYLGVNDHGIPIGLAGDLDTMRRRHNIPDPTLDHMMRHINREGERQFSEPVWRYVRLIPMSQFNIIKMEIEPYPYDIVTLKGQAYIRKNNSSALIRDARTKLDIRRRRQEALRRSDDKYILLQEAVQQKRQTRLLNYRSSNSATIKNRLVEPFAFDGTDYVICYEDGTVKSFKISRIGQVKILDEKWKHEEEHHSRQFDDFHMSGTDPIPIELDLRLPAKNILEDLYPRLRERITQTSDDLWRLSTQVYSLVPLRAVYLSYAADITIVQAPGLREEAQDYYKKYIEQ